MAHAEGGVTIDRPVTTVFNFIADGSNNSLWRSSVTGIQRVPDKPQGLGAVFKQVLKGPGGRIYGDYEIVEYQPNKRIKFQVIARHAKPTGTYTFESLGDSTR